MFLFFYYCLSCLIASLLCFYLPTLTATFMYKDVSTLLAKISQLWILIITWIYLIWIQSVCLYEVLVQTFPNGPCTPQLFIFFMKCLTIFILIGLSAEIKIGNSKLEINTVYQIIWLIDTVTKLYFLLSLKDSI